MPRWRRSPHRSTRRWPSCSPRPRSARASPRSPPATGRRFSPAASTRRSSRCSRVRASRSTWSRTASTRGPTGGASAGTTTRLARSAATAASAVRSPPRQGRSSTWATATPIAARRLPPTACSPTAVWPTTSPHRTTRSSRSRRSTTLLLRCPEPYDFALSTERFRTFGVDLANLWHEGGLHRVVGTREVRIEAAPGGVDVEPLDAETAPVVEKLLGAQFDLEPFYVWAAGQRVLGELAVRLAGFRPPLAPDPFESLVTSIT